MIPRLPWRVVRYVAETGSTSAKALASAVSLGAERSSGGLRDEENQGHGGRTTDEPKLAYEVVSGPQTSD